VEDSLLKALQATEDPLEKAALVAEAIFERLPRETTLAARRCIVLHWFDLSIVEALLEESELTIDEMNDIYEQLAALPFVDTIQSRLLFQNITRQGLLARYSLNQPELLRTAARLAAPIYEAREEDEKSIAEAFFCYRVSGDRKASVAIQNELFEQVSHQDWRRIENLLRLQDEAESLPFVQPLPRTELQFLLRGLVHRMNGEQEAAILDYNQSLSLNPKSTLAYINRGTTYAEQKRFDEALSDYNTALQIDKSVVQAYANRGVIYAKQARYAEALKDFERAIEAGLLNSFVLRNKSETLNELGRYEEALVTYDEILRLSPEDVEAYIGRGQSLNQLEDYEQALTSFEEALRFNPDSASACRGKGYALNGLERYVEALVAYDQALALDANSAEAYRGKGKALSSLKRYEEASATYIKADQLDPQHREGMVEDENIRESTTARRRKRSLSNNQGVFTSLWAKRAQLFHLSPSQIRSNIPERNQRGSTIGVPATIKGRSSALVAVSLIILFSLLFFSHTGTFTGGKENSLPPYFSGNGQLTLYDPLTDNSKGYHWLPTTSSGLPTKNGNCAFKGRALDASVNGDENYTVLFHPCIESTTDFGDLAYEVNMTINVGDCGGVTFRGVNSALYYFVICHDGRYRLVRYAKDPGTDVTPAPTPTDTPTPASAPTDTPIPAPTPTATATSGVTPTPTAVSPTPDLNPALRDSTSQSINTGFGQSNTIAIEAKGSHIDLYVNQMKIDSADDPTGYDAGYRTGKVGVIAKSWSLHDLTDVAFTNARVWTLTPQKRVKIT